MPAGPDPLALLPGAKRLLRTVRGATLATIDPDGAPFASLTAIATLPDGRPILLLSRLAAHTGHLAADGRCSILLAQPGKGDPLAHPRLTLQGVASLATDTAAARDRFLRRNPKAELYADFPDFGFWTVVIARGSLNGGFGKAAQFSGHDLGTDTDGCDGLLAGEAGAIAHMNADHRDAIATYATRLLGEDEADWRLSGLDPEGADLLAGERTARLPFPERVRSTADLRSVLVRLAAEARQNG